jgi:hypothetical protein
MAVFRGNAAWGLERQTQNRGAGGSAVIDRVGASDGCEDFASIASARGLDPLIFVPLALTAELDACGSGCHGTAEGRQGAWDGGDGCAITGMLSEQYMDRYHPF